MKRLRVWFIKEAPASNATIELHSTKECVRLIINNAIARACIRLLGTTVRYAGNDSHEPVASANLFMEEDPIANSIAASLVNPDNPDQSVVARQNGELSS